MAGEFHLSLYVAHPLHERSSFERLWALFADPSVGASRWGREERTTETFTPDPAPAHAVLRSGWLFVDGTKDGIQSAVVRQRGNLYTVDVWFAAPALDDRKRRDAWLAWMLRLVEAFPVLFGHGETKPEHDAKHLVDTGDSESWVGASLAELHAFLPGIYWLTVFGRALASALPIDKLADQPELTVHRIASGGVAVVLNEPVKPKDLSKRLSAVRRLAALLGDDLFYDRERPDRQLRAIPEFVTELERAKGSQGQVKR